MEKKVLVLAANEGELKWMNGYQETSCATLGVGKVLSAVNATIQVQKIKPDHVLLVGWSGAVDPSFSIGDGFWGSRCVQYDIDLQSFKMPRGVVPDGKKSSVGSLPLFFPPQAHTTVLGTADRFLLRSYREANPWISEELSIGLSDMESYGVAYAMQQLNVPLSIYRVVSDDSKGHRPKKFGVFMKQSGLLFSKALETIQNAD